MKIGIVVNSSWNIYNFRLGLVKSFLQKGHQVVAIAPDDGYRKELRSLGCDFVPLKISSKGTNPLKDLLLVNQLCKIYKKIRPDVVLHYTIKPNIYGTLAARMLHIPAVNNVTGLGTVFIRQNLTAKIAHLLYKLSFRFPETVFFQNRDDKNVFLEKKLVKEGITDLLPGSGIDLDHFKPSKNRQNKTFTFLMIARLLYDKGIIEYMEAARKLKASGHNVCFQVLGRVEQQKGLGISLEKIHNCHKEGVVEYLGTVDDVRPIISKADCVVLPSYREGTPRTLLEAAGIGKPLVTTDVPGCRETVRNGYNGFLCQARSADELAEAMLKMYMQSPEDLRLMGRNSREYIERNFDQKIVINKYEKVLQELGGDFSVQEEKYASEETVVI